MNTSGKKEEKTTQKKPTQPEMVLYLSGKQIIHFLLAFLFSAKCQKIPMTVFTKRPQSGIQICSKQILNSTVEFSCIYIQLAVGSSLKSSVVLIYRLCRENDGQKVENGMLSAALCAGSVTVIVALLSCRKYFNRDNRLHCAQEVIYFHSC